MNLKNKLNIYCTEKKQFDRNTSWIEALGGLPITTPYGQITTFVQHYDITAFNLPNANIDLSSYCHMHRIDSCTLNQCVFFDVETTSLTSGTGTYTFLIGLGYCTNTTFTVEQIFMQQYSDEPAMLYHCAQVLNRFNTIVTFNGKTFDIPIIKTRFRMNRIQGYPVSMPIIDLLKTARSIFRSIYASCSLKSLEELLLGITRTDDIPGYLIPDVYFTYQKNGYDPRIISVIEHNRIDITSMVSLLVFFNTLYEIINAKQFQHLPTHLYKNIAKHLYSRNIQLFIELVEFAGYALLDNDHSLFKKYSTALKRLGQIDKALAFWNNNINLFSLEELAKHYEHRVKDYQKALEYCNRAIDTMHKTMAYNEITERYRVRFLHRINRLTKKLQ